MVVVHSGIMQAKIKELVLANQEYCFTFVKKEGIKLYFTIAQGDENEAAVAAKKAIKADPICSGLLVSVKVEQ